LFCSQPWFPVHVPCLLCRVRRLTKQTFKQPSLKSADMAAIYLPTHDIVANSNRMTWRYKVSSLLYLPLFPLHCCCSSTVYTYRPAVSETSLLGPCSLLVDYGFSLFISLLCRDVIVSVCLHSSFETRYSLPSNGSLVSSFLPRLGFWA
jgi:hypothetical protein